MFWLKDWRDCPKISIIYMLYCVKNDKFYIGSADVMKSMRLAARELNISNSHISECCHGKRKTCGVFSWNLIKNNPQQIAK